MNHSDRFNGPLPARASDIPPPSFPVEYDDHASDPYAQPTSSNKITVKLVGRALRRHWWQALLLWIVGSVGLMALAYQRVKPTYDAFAAVRINQGDSGILVDKNNRTLDLGEYKETQVKAITNPNVLSATLSADPTLLQLSRLRDAIDPEAEIRSSIMAMVVPKTSLIQISMSSESSDEAAKLVNAVVSQYLKQANDFSDNETDRITKRLRELKNEYKADVDLKREALQNMMKKREIGDALASKERNSVEKERYSQLLQTLTTLELELVEAESHLALLQSDPSSAAVVNTDPQGQLTEQDLRDEFYAIPQVAAIRDKLNLVIKKKNELRRVLRNPMSDPTYLAADKTYLDYQNQLKDMFEELKPRLMQNRAAPAVASADNGLRSAEVRVQGLRSKIEMLTKTLEGVSIKTRADSQELLALELLRDEMKSAQGMLDTVQKQLSQAEFEAKNPVARVSLEYAAKPSSRPNTNNRTKIMAVAPFGMLVLVMALCVIIELSAGRVVDPDDLPGRVHVPVIGVVPPLPQVRPAVGLLSSRDEFRTQRQLDQFVQSLDHLRVALTSSRGSHGRERRCVLITSACSSEGKTTLAAQLAERCVNAGLLTLLIDADLRNPTLSRMLDVPSNRGLINILRGETSLEDAMTTVGGAGGFHFLPAGTPKVDPSRLLHGDRLAKLLGHARDNFDIVIVDAPPVLPVPDALTIGKWTDGAILAVRYDTSRFPLVERANKRLASVGVSVIGAVVNGVRVVESTYGSYYPSYAYTNDRAAQTPLDV